MITYDRPFAGRLVLGVVLVALGAVWTLDNLGLADAGLVLRWWPLALIGYGAGKLAGVLFSRQPVVGAVALTAGAVLLAGNLGVAHVGIGLLVSIGLVMFGVTVIRNESTPVSPGVAVTDTGDRIRSFAIMGGASTRSKSQALRHIELTTLLGGVELDLREARAAGGRVKAEVFAFLGGIDIILPPSWTVELEATPVMGAIQDERVVATEASPESVLVLRGGVLLGGIVLRSAPEERPRVRVGVVTRRGRRFVTDVHLGDHTVHIRREPWDTGREPVPPPPGPAAPPPSETR